MPGSISRATFAILDGEQLNLISIIISVSHGLELLKNQLLKEKKLCSFVLPNSAHCIHKELRVKLPE